MPKANQNKPQRDPTDFFNRTWLILVILVIFAPAGIYLLWKHKKFDPVVRIILSVVFALIFGYNSMGLFAPPAAPQTPPAQPAQTEPSNSEKQAGEPENKISIVDEYIPPAFPSPDFAGSRLLKVHFLDVGQGDSIVVQTPEGQAVLVDGGNRESGEFVKKYLHSLGVKELLAVVATHPHEDHIGGLIPVLQSFPVKNIYMPDAAHTTATFETFLNEVENSDANKVIARVGRNIPVDELDMAMLFLAPNSNQYDSLNDYSAVLKISFKDISFLLTGDAEAVSEQEMLDYNRNINSTVLKVAHHGSRSSSTEAFLEAVDPVYTVISCGKDNEYGYPHEEAFLRLKESGANIFRTDVSGTLIFETDGEKLGIKKH